MRLLGMYLIAHNTGFHVHSREPRAQYDYVREK